MKSGRIVLLVLIFLVIFLCWCASLYSRPSQGDREEDRMTICHSCFWAYHPEGLKESLTDFYQDHLSQDFFISAEAYYLMGRMIPSESMIRAAFAQYKYALELEKDPFRKMLINEIIGMLSTDVKIDPDPYFKKASRLAKKMKMKWRSKLMKSLASGDFTPTFGDYQISRDLSVPSDAEYFILGKSSITVSDGAKIGVQLERTFRDWLSCQFQYDFLKSYSFPENVLNYHEGTRLGDLMKYARTVPVPLTGTLLAYREGKWYAPDEEGIFRFEVLEDKVQYPTTKQYKNIALMLDTHGVSTIVEQAVREGVDLVIACGDNPPKAKAAAYLADRGIDVYFPCDREIGMMVGYEGKAVVLGTAPIRKKDSGAIIGNQPVRFSIKEPIVVQDIKRDSAARYYDSASRYFKALNSYVPLNLHAVRIEAEKETYKIIEEATKRGAKAIGVRVCYEEDYDAVKNWLEQSEENRAVLFHSAPYEPGYRLFFEFPAQVTFGDPRPQFSSRE